VTWQLSPESYQRRHDLKKEAAPPLGNAHGSQQRAELAIKGLLGDSEADSALEVYWWLSRLSLLSCLIC
jgi:hypothetical protein